MLIQGLRSGLQIGKVAKKGKDGTNGTNGLNGLIAASYWSLPAGYFPSIQTGILTFTLPAVSASPSTSLLYLNGVKLDYGIDYTINSDQLVWLGTYPYDPLFFLELYYD